MFDGEERAEAVLSFTARSIAFVFFPGHREPEDSAAWVSYDFPIPPNVRRKDLDEIFVLATHEAFTSFLGLYLSQGL